MHIVLYESFKVLIILDVLIHINNNQYILEYFCVNIRHELYAMRYVNYIIIEY